MDADPVLANASVKKTKAPKRYIKTTVTVHDRTQLQTVFDYFLYRGGSAATTDQGRAANGAVKTGRTVRLDGAKKSAVKAFIPSAAVTSTLSYKVDAYLFYPRQFGLNEHTYKKERFFADVRPLLRFREPKVGFRTMVGQKPGALSPLVFLRDFISGLNSEQGNESEQNAVDETRLFACAFVSTYLRGIERNRRRVNRLVSRSGGPTKEEVERICARMHRLLDRATTTLGEFQMILDLAIAQPPEVIVALREELRLVDEYCCYRLRDGASYLIRMQENLHACTVGPETVALRAAILRVLAANAERTAAYGYMEVTAASSELVKERFIHRRNELKRRIWAVLFLEVRTKPLFSLQRQIGAMIAAGLAAVWAVVIQYLMVRNVIKSESVADSVGLSGLFFLTAGILAYVVKDRIKDVGKSYFGNGIFHRIPDNSERIYYKNRSGKPTEVGSIQESAKFVAISALPPALVELRDAVQDAKVYGASSISQVLHYAKSITLSGKLRILNRYPLRAVHDILRLNIDACLPQLGEPTRTLDLVAPSGEVEAVRFPKVYYLDMILSYSRVESSGVEQRQALDYFRLVIDKNGLLRIERLN